MVSDPGSFQTACKPAGLGNGIFCQARREIQALWLGISYYFDTSIIISQTNVNSLLTHENSVGGVSSQADGTAIMLDSVTSFVCALFSVLFFWVVHYILYKLHQN